MKKNTPARVYGPDSASIDTIDHLLPDNEQVRILGLDFEILAVPGHTLDHIAYFHAGCELSGGKNWLFCGDTLFAGGCGRVFEGTMAQMHRSLERLATLPSDTEIYCAHEYTLANLRFAMAVEPENPALQSRMHQVTRARKAMQPTVPSDLATELATNPFLRCHQEAITSAVRRHGDISGETSADIFAGLRRWKDNF